ncbi:acetyltransferase [Demequina sp. SYSU T00068]|uniref:acetyltransferase n=1 Tax=Demequina lignilytica TaxID=3051663 RepID=UPI0026112C8A|nr:acetyltransferase [Demequina sp. SYSU T00068]MDN4490654.1 acetyltransferase [Demequina sp. SYSU T00068]
MAEHTPESEADIPVIPLKDAPGERATWGRPPTVVFLWGLCEWLFVTNALQISSRLRVAVLRAFGAKIGSGVIFRPRTRVRFPWKLEIGDDCWIGEGVWIHNQDQVTIGHDVVISQETFITTGSHAHRRDMALVTRPVVVGAGAWLTARCIVTGGVTIGKGALVSAGSVVPRDIGPGSIATGNPAVRVGDRFMRGSGT